MDRETKRKAIEEQQPTHNLENESLKDFYAKRGFTGRVGFGERPAVIVIDLARGWTEPYPISPMGSDLSKVVEQTVRILKVAREKDVPIYFTTMGYEPGLTDIGEVVLKKTPHLKIMEKGSDWLQLHPALDRRPNEVFIIKQRASAFWGTSLLSQLISRKVDTVILTGCSTSGCVRATAQNAFDDNLHVIVPREAVGDRSPTAHEANLFDIDARNGDVVSVDEVLEYLRRL